MTVLSLTAHDVTYQIYESPGLGPSHKTSVITRTVRTGTPYEAVLLEHIGLHTFDVDLNDGYVFQSVGVQCPDRDLTTSCA